jgi:xanthine/CO dehydrogenase XdhC/CoxF family maturation factor
LAVIMSHHFETDREALRELLPSRAHYIGVLGPAKRTRRLLDEISGTSRTWPKRVRQRVHGPAGLQLGAESPHEIALSILAEAQAVLTSSSGCSLRERDRPIHEKALPAAAQLRMVTPRGP